LFFFCFFLHFWIPISYSFHFAKNWVVLVMESQGNVQDVGVTNPTGVTGGPHPVANPSIFAQRPPIAPTPFFHGYHGAGNQMPFLYPHSYMPPIPGFGFGAPAQGSPSVPIDLTEGSQKRGPKVPSMTTPNPRRSGEQQRRNLRLSNWTMPKTMWTS
jgi:hypothetical protein